MFYDTGIGKEGYSIIGQGQIDKILSGKPEERRELFDEAAGIVKFKRRKATTLKKLDEERQNLVRVTDILSELTKQLGPLEKQSETARIYLAKREELKELDVNLFLLDHQRTGELLKELEEKLEQAYLYDFYGELLTEHQQRVYEDAVYNDMSLSEIAGEQGISRQGVHDLIKRCDRILQDYESKLHLVERFMAAKEKIGEIEQLTAENDTDPGERMERIRELSRSLLKEW